ncbi:PIG-L family deacetylase [Gammaproteobacteria bacterium]|nr:PIG-L family deacetylase [Gammaproteobacteria bacterium]
MNKRLLVIAPHPDDEVLGVGGTILRAKAEGYAVAWVIVTEISEKAGWPAEKVTERSKEIEAVNEIMDFDKVYNLGFPTMTLDQVSVSAIVTELSQVVSSFKPTDIYLPHPGDAHSDHKAVFEASISSTKWFRHSYVERVFAYETLSETDAGLSPDSRFHPNWFVDISPFMERKLQAMGVYCSEVGEFPFPRSFKAIEALASLRGAASGFSAAEAFQLLRSRETLD